MSINYLTKKLTCTKLIQTEFDTKAEHILLHFTNILFQAGEIVLSSNDETPRDPRCNTGRVYLFQKQHAGYVEPENMLVALQQQYKLHEARQSDEQVGGFIESLLLKYIFYRIRILAIENR